MRGTESAVRATSSDCSVDLVLATSLDVSGIPEPDASLAPSDAEGAFVRAFRTIYGY